MVPGGGNPVKVKGTGGVRLGTAGAARFASISRDGAGGDRPGSRGWLSATGSGRAERAAGAAGARRLRPPSAPRRGAGGWCPSVDSAASFGGTRGLQGLGALRLLTGVFTAPPAGATALQRGGPPPGCSGVTGAGAAGTGGWGQQPVPLGEPGARLPAKVVTGCSRNECLKTKPIQQ